MPILQSLRSLPVGLRCYFASFFLLLLLSFNNS
nr:MAG TPA: hypothetical protein [Caudoviricetes sp.]